MLACSASTLRCIDFEGKKRERDEKGRFETAQLLVHGDVHAGGHEVFVAILLACSNKGVCLVQKKRLVLGSGSSV